MVLLVLGCSGKQSVSETKEKAELSRQKVVRIVFNLPGDDIGSQESLKILEEIKAALLANRAGDIVSSGFGMGTMEIVVAIGSDESTNEIRRAIGEVYPKAKFRIEQTTK